MSEEYDDPKGEEPGYAEDGPNLRFDDFVGRIVQDPNEPPSVTLLSGFLGSSSEAGHVRLYLDEELSSYVEIPEKAIRHTQEIPPEQSPLGGSLVWIDQDAEVLHGAAGSERRKATFLEGQIAQDYIPGAGGYGMFGVESGPEGGGEGGGDYGGSTQSRECGGGIGVRPSVAGPGCGQSAFGPCIPRTELPGCHTRTGILCTLFGPSCRTRYLPQCRSLYIPQCQSVASPCFTVHEPRCVESGFVGCGPLEYTTIWQEQFDPQAGFAEAAQFRAGFPPPTNYCPPTQLISCQSRFVAACFTRFPNECQFETFSGCQTRVFRCPTIDFRCPTRFEPRCRISAVAFCPDTQAGCQVNTANCGIEPGGGGAAQRKAGPAAMPAPVRPTTFCVSQLSVCPTRLPALCRTRTPVYCPPTWFNICYPTRSDCPTLPPGCPEPTAYFQCETFGGCPSAVDACPTRFGCESQVGCYESIACQSQGCFPGGGFEQGGGGGVAGGGGGGEAAQGFGAAGFAAQPTPQTVYYCAAGGGGGAGAAIPQTRFCPSRYTPCQSQNVRCPSALDACPTRYNCPSVASPCVTRDFACETRGACPSAVDACPTRFGCYQTQICVTQVCQVSQVCDPQGGGGFDPGGGGGFGGGF